MSPVLPPEIVTPRRRPAQLRPASPWWRNLDPQFPAYRVVNRMDRFKRLRMQTSSLTDLGLRAGIIAATTALSLPWSLRPDTLLRDRRERAFYHDLATDGDAHAFFQKPKPGIRVRVRHSGPLAHQPKDGQSYLLSFKSPFEAVNPRVREDYHRHDNNEIAWAQYWKHGDKPRPTIAVIHGFIMDSYWVNSKFFALEWFYEQGYDVLLYTLPFHGYRQGLLSPFSGHGYFSHGPLHMNEVHAHAIHDFRVFLDWLLSHGVPSVGVTGISMGGYATALLASVEERLAFAIPVVPPASLVDMVFEWPVLGHLIRSALATAGISIQEARHTLAVNSPLTWQLAIPKDRVLLIGGMDDRITFTKHTMLLWEHWDRPAVHWFPGGHVLHWGQGDYLKAMRRFLDGIGFKP